MLVAGLKPVLSCAEGQEAVISTEYIYVTDADSDNSSLAFLIAREPDHGVVLRNGVAVDRFIQADITAGIISYKHTGWRLRAVDGSINTKRNQYNAVLLIVPKKNSILVLITFDWISFSFIL